MTEGLQLKFHTLPPLRRFPTLHCHSSLIQLPKIRKFLPNLLSRNIIRKICTPQLLFFSRLFLVPKKDNSDRLVIDLSILNKYLIIPTFKMETIETISPCISVPMWGCTLDLQDAYFHVPVNWFFQIFLAFMVDHQIYVFQFLPFGLSVAPWTFSRIIKPIKAHIHLLTIRFHTYLDDFLILSLTPKSLTDHLSYIISLLETLGFLINIQKSQLIPSQTIEYLGVNLHLDSLLLSLPHSKVLAITAMCQDTLLQSHRSRRQLESLVGLLNFASSLVPLGRLRLRPIISWMNSHTSPPYKRSSRSSRPISQKTSSSLDRSNLLNLSSPHEPPNSLSSIDDRLLKEGLERNSPSLQNLRRVAKVIQGPDIQLVGTERNFPVGNSLSSTPKRPIRPNSFRQHDSSGLYSTSRDTPVPSPDGPVPMSPRILFSSQHSFNPEAHKRNLECSSRSGISPCSDLDRMETRSPNIPLANRTSGLNASGSFRHSRESPSPLLRVPLPRPKCSGNQRSFSPVEPLGLDISISSNRSSSQGLLSSPKVPGSRSVGCSLPCSVKLAPQPAPQSSEPHSSSRGLFTVPEHHQGHSIPPKSICFLPSRVDTMKIGLKSLGFDPSGTKMLLRSLKDTSTKNYQGAWSKFLSYLSRNNYSYKDTSVGTVCNFLTYEATINNLKYRTLTGYRSALRLPILWGCGVEIVNIASNVFLRGLYSYNPPLKTKPMPIWNLNTLLNFLQSDRFEPLDSVSFLRLTEKTLCLILLASGRRIGEVANLSRIYHDNHSKNSIIMEWVPGFRAKNDNPGFQPPSPSMNRLVSENLSLCPVRAYKIYLEKSQCFLIPPNIQSFLWVLPNTPDNLILKKLTSTFISVVKDALRDADLSFDISIGPHQMRKLSASHAWKAGQDEEIIREIMGFASLMILRKNYIAEVPNLNIACVLPGGSFSPPMDE